MMRSHDRMDYLRILWSMVPPRAHTGLRMVAFLLVCALAVLAIPIALGRSLWLWWRERPSRTA